MNHELLKTIIADQHELIRNEDIVEREYSFEPNANYVLVGLRRSGKSTLLHKKAQDLIREGMIWNQIIYINFEDERLTEFHISDFNDILQVQSELSDQRGFFFFDEIQNIEGWEKFARRLADAKEHVYITGSNAKMLSGEIETTLGGRYFTKRIYPYNFREYLRANGVPFRDEELLTTKTNGQLFRAFTNYLNFGGFPELLRYQSGREYITNIYQKILLGDIIARRKIRNSHAMRLLMKKIAESVMNEISYSKLHNTIKTVGVSLSKDAVIDYILYAEEAFLIFGLKNFVAKFAEREGNIKYYFSDNGLLNLFLVNKNAALLENIIAIELYKRYSDNLYYFRSSRTGIDIDFVIPDEGIAIQVAYSIAGDARKREIDNLIKFWKSFEKIKRCIIITNEEEERIEGEETIIEVIPAHKFLQHRPDVSE